MQRGDITIPEKDARSAEQNFLTKETRTLFYIQIF